MTNKVDKPLSEMFNLRRFGIVLDLSLMETIMKRLDIPSKAYRTVHIAGSNGKGSIAASIASILSNEGYRTGLYTSPHLVKFNERITIDNTPIADNEIEPLFQKVKSVTEDLERSPTFFEYTTAMAFYYFYQNHVDWAVIETGMGGRLDATNVVKPEVSIITNISLEHQSYLGNTLSAIAKEKAGIIKENTPVVTGVKQKEALAVIKKQAEKNKASVYENGTDFFVKDLGQKSFTYQGIEKKFSNMRISLEGNHQLENASLTLCACELLNKKKEVISTRSIREGLAATKWPGRLEKVLSSPPVFLDGAHNLSAASNLKRYLSQHFKTQNITLILGILDDKPYAEMAQILCQPASRVILTQAKINRAVPADTLFEVVKPFMDHATVISDVGEALNHAIDNASSDEVICVAGSLYVVGEAKMALENRT